MQEEKTNSKAMNLNGEIAIFSGNANPKLAKDVCKCLGLKMGNMRVGTFSDGETDA